MICIGSAYEHDAVDRWLNVRVKNLEELETVLQEYPNEDKLVFWMGVNNITGEIFNIVSIGNMSHQYGAFYICDSTALWGHTVLPDNIDEWCDCVVQSSHKVGTEIGLGCMWLSDRFNEWLGDFKLHGTPNLAGACTITDATEDACQNVAAHEDYCYELYRHLLSELSANGIHGGVVNSALKRDKSDATERAPSTYAINAIMLDNINAIALQNYLANKEIYIGIGQSSCADIADRRVLCQGCNLSEQEADRTVRISFGEDSSFDEIDKLVKNICEFKKIYIDK